MDYQVILGRKADEGPAAPLRAGIAVHRSDGSLRTLAEIQNDFLQYALFLHEDQKAPVARALGIGRSTLYRLDHAITERPVRSYRKRAPKTAALQ